MAKATALWATTLALTLVSAGFSTAVQAADGNFYSGKTLRIISGGSVGGGYDTYARLISRHIGKHIPGSPNVVVQNMPAGGGLAATNHIFNVADKDGTEIGLFNRNTLFTPLLDKSAANFAVESFNWLGTPASYSDNAYTFIIRSALPYKTFDDLRNAPTPLNVGAISSVPVRITQESLGAKLKLIKGYTGNQMDMAFESGEIDAMGISYADIQSHHPDWISRKLMRVMVQFGSDKRLPVLADVPTARELARNAEDRQLIEFSELALTLGFPVAAPPGVPADRVDILRKAFAATMNDADYRADGAKIKMEHSPKLGADLLAEMIAMGKTPAAVTERYKKMAGGS